MSLQETLKSVKNFFKSLIHFYLTTAFYTNREELVIPSKICLGTYMDTHIHAYMPIVNSQLYTCIYPHAHTYKQSYPSTSIVSETILSLILFFSLFLICFFFVFVSLFLSVSVSLPLPVSTSLFLPSSYRPFFSSLSLFLFPHYLFFSSSSPQSSQPGHVFLSSFFPLPEPLFLFVFVVSACLFFSFNFSSFFPSCLSYSSAFPLGLGHSSSVFFVVPTFPPLSLCLDFSSSCLNHSFFFSLFQPLILFSICCLNLFPSLFQPLFLIPIFVSSYFFNHYPSAMRNVPIVWPISFKNT